MQESQASRRTFKQAFHPNRADLIQKIDPSLVLLNRLRGKGLLTKELVQAIQACDTQISKVDKLLDALENSDDNLLHEFIDALKYAEQQHIVRDWFPDFLPPCVVVEVQTDCTISPTSECPWYATKADHASTQDRVIPTQTDDSVLVIVEVQTDCTIPPASECRLYATNAVHASTQARVKRRVIETQTQCSFSDAVRASIPALVKQLAISTQIDDSFSDYLRATSYEVQQRHQQQFVRMPLELLEMILMQTFIIKFTDHYKDNYKIYEPRESAYSTLAAVCYNWWQTLNGWPQSSTRHWLRHKLRRAIAFIARPYLPWPRQIHPSLHTVSEIVGITVCDNKLFVVLTGSDSIRVFGPNTELIRIIKIKQLREPHDIVVCCETEQLYVAGEGHSYTSQCVWKAPISGKPVVKWLPNKITTTTQFKPLSLSVTSRRLLVASQCNGLMLYGADGTVLKRVPLPGKDLLHAVETPSGNFIISHWDKHTHQQVCEINSDGHVTRIYSGQLSRPDYLSLDSDGRVFVADTLNNRILLLNNSLELNRIILDKEHDNLVPGPRRLHYAEQTGQLYVVGRSDNFAQIFRVRYI